MACSHRSLHPRRDACLQPCQLLSLNSITCGSFPSRTVAGTDSCAQQPAGYVEAPEDPHHVPSNLRQRAPDWGVAPQYNVIVTAGANQALSSCMLALVDPQDSVCIFKPYYFNCLVRGLASFISHQIFPQALFNDGAKAPGWS